MAKRALKKKRAEPKNEGVDRIDIANVEEWEKPPRMSFGQRASLEIARYVLLIFAGIYLFCFVLAFYMITLPRSWYNKSVELIKYLVGSILPLVTLAVE